MIELLIGLGLLVALVLIFILFGKLYSYFASMNETEAMLEIMMWSGVLGIFVGIPIGIFFLARFLGGLVT